MVLWFSLVVSPSSESMLGRLDRRGSNSSLWYGVCGIAWQCMVYDIALHAMAWYVERHYKLCSITCSMALPCPMVMFTPGQTNVSWRSCSHVQDPFTRRRPFTCMFHSHLQLLLTRTNISKRSTGPRTLDIHSYSC